MSQRFQQCIGLAFSVAVLATCTEEVAEPPPEPLPLNQRLAPGEVRAGVIVEAAALLTGPTAKGRVGDYKLYNDQVAFIIAAAGRAAGFNPHGGTIVDADLIRQEGEAGHSTFGEVIVGVDLSVIEPSSVEVISDGADGTEARIRVRGAEGPLPLIDVILSELIERKPHDVDFDVDYVLAPDARWLRIEYNLHNRGKAFVELGAPISVFMFGDGAQAWLPGYGYVEVDSGATGEVYGAIADDVSYLYGRPDKALEVVLNRSGIVVAIHGKEAQLRGGETVTIEHLLVVGGGDLADTQRTWRQATATPEPPLLSGTVAYPDGTPVANARVHVLDSDPVRAARDYVTTARTDDAGRWQASLRPGSYQVAASIAGHRASTLMPVSHGASGSVQDLELAPPGFVRYSVTDDKGRALPAKLTVRPQAGGTERPPARFGEAPEPGGVLHTEYNTSGTGRFELPAGDHEIWVSRGGEYDVVTQQITVVPGEETAVSAKLTRVLDTTGWMSTDTHVHAQLSPDSPDLYPFKVAALVVEGLELPISTEHEAIGDFNPAIKELGLESWMQGVIGSEVTTYVYGHFNAWPLVQDFSKPGNGRIDWYYKDPVDTFAAIRANAGDPFIQVNHPRSPSIGGYFSAMGYDASTGGAARTDVWSDDFDGIEVANGCGVGHIEGTTQVDWFSFLNAGVRKWALGSTDSHKAGYGQLGYPRTYVRMPTDEPADADIADLRAAMKAGRMIVTCGPFFTVSVGAAGVGDTAAVAAGQITATVSVQAPPYMDVDSIEIVVNGAVVATEAVAETTDIVRFDGTIDAPVPQGRDGWMIVRVRGDQHHSQWASRRPSYAFSNPIFLDGNGDGEWVMTP